MGWGIALHGGAGKILQSLPLAAKEASEDALKEILDAGVTALQDGRPALDVVELVVKLLEACPLFNAGVGSVLTQRGTVEMESSIMDGSTGRCGAVSGLSTVVHPISLARLVMEKTPHVYLGFEGAETFAKDQGVERRDSSYFITPGNCERLKKAQEAGLVMLDHSVSTDSGPNVVYANGSANRPPRRDDEAQFETVGCAAVDVHGHCAAATSTGGLVNKMVGRIGDTPLIGAGTYANDICAISLTGKGEDIIRCLAAKEVASVMEYKGLPLQEAADYVMWKKMDPGSAGLVSVSNNGEIAMSFNTQGMYRAAATQDGLRQIGIWKDAIDIAS